MMKVITFKNRSIPVFYSVDKSNNYQKLNSKLQELELDFSFRKKWKTVESVEMVRDVAIFQYRDGTKLYLEVS